MIYIENPSWAPVWNEVHLSEFVFQKSRGIASDFCGIQTDESEHCLHEYPWSMINYVSSTIFFFPVMNSQKQWKSPWNHRKSWVEAGNHSAVWKKSCFIKYCRPSSTSLPHRSTPLCSLYHIMWRQTPSTSSHLQGSSFKYVPSQWEMTLQCNVISHWLGTYTKDPCIHTSPHDHRPGVLKSLDAATLRRWPCNDVTWDLTSLVA